MTNFFWDTEMNSSLVKIGSSASIYSNIFVVKCVYLELARLYLKASDLLVECINALGLYQIRVSQIWYKVGFIGFSIKNQINS